MPRTILMLWVLAAGPLTAEAQTPHERGLLVGTWQLDSLRVVPIVSELSDSARASLDRYTPMLANANDQFASGRMRIVTEYTRDGRFIHSVFEGSTVAAVHREVGHWERSDTGAIACPHEPGTGHCPHHGATVIAVDERQLVLQLDLSGAARGLRETFWLTRSALLAAVAPTSVHSQRGSVLSSIPAQPRPDRQYVIYLHGRIIEDKGTRPTDERFGIYEYQQILDTLATSGADVIAEHRPQGTDFHQFGVRVAGQIHDLLAAGVPAERIAVIGFSKGGAIAIIAAARLADPRIRFVFLGACGDWLAQRTDVDVGGSILSIYERSDELGTSCQPLFSRARAPGERQEIMIDTGAAHGAFYRPRSEWLGPVFRWLEGSQLDGQDRRLTRRIWTPPGAQHAPFIKTLLK